MIPRRVLDNIENQEGGFDNDNDNDDGAHRRVLMIKTRRVDLSQRSME